MKVQERIKRDRIRRSKAKKLKAELSKAVDRFYGLEETDTTMQSYVIVYEAEDGMLFIEYKETLEDTTARYIELTFLLDGIPDMADKDFGSYYDGILEGIKRKSPYANKNKTVIVVRV